MPVLKIREKPVEMEAMEWDGTVASAQEIMSWVEHKVGWRKVSVFIDCLHFHGQAPSIGHRGCLVVVNGHDVYPVPADIWPDLFEFL